jgi:hypothetical protein
MKSGFDYKEYVNWCKKLEISIDNFQIWLKTFLLQQAQRVVARGKPLTPVDTGFLRNSWYIGSQNIEQKRTNKVSKSGNFMAEIDWSKSDIADISVVGNELQVEIGLSAEYASAIEYGHGSYQGKYMLHISIDEVQRQLPARFNKEWLQFIKSGGAF